MSSLYRCRARVGYRPFRSEQLIVFDERQIQELSVDLKWEPGLSQLNQDTTTTPTAATNFLNQSKCQVTISDPYLTGLAWPALYDAASIYTASNIAAANNILLPACTKDQDPVADKCFKYVDLEVDKDDPVNAQGNFALLMLSLWYDVAGTSFGTDFYFRVDGFSVSHGSRYPSVTIRGVEARSVLFNQSLVNMTFDEGAEIEKVLKDISEEMGYSVSFCANTNSEPEKKRLLPRSIRFKGVTPDEAIKKVIDSVGGNTLTLPTREYANKISMCTRGEIDQGCSVFYLGKGLYESYEINGQPDLTILALNLERNSNRNEGSQYVSEAFNAASYTVQNITPERRKKAMEKVKKVAFPKLFEPVSPHIKGAPRLTGFAWKDSKPAPGPGGGGITVINERVKDVNLFGIAPNGTTAISYLSGKVREADTANGKVIISTKFFLQVCDTQDTKKCFSRQIRQETTGLSNVKVKANDVLEISQEIGSSTADKPEFTRFFIEGFKNELVTLNPQIVWGWAVPEEELKDAAPKNAPASGQAPTPTPASGSVVIGKVGSTGRSTGPHIHVETVPRGSITEQRLDELVSRYISFAGKSRGRGFSGHGYPGIDYPAPNGSPISLINGASVASVGETSCAGGSECGGGFGNNITIQTPEGIKILLAHLAPQSIPPNIAGLRSSSGGGKGSPNMQAAPATQGLTLETGFKGIPRTLRIIPGRTILSLISDYDSWIENGGPRGDDNNTDPGIWIPTRFKNWFITQCKYKWRDGDLRVDLEGRSAWGTRDIKAPTFPNYLTSMKKSGELKNTTDYYGYMRSLGDLHWKMEGTGKDSTEELCGEAQYWSQAAAEGPDTTTPTSVQSAYPTAKCQYNGSKYPKDRVQAIINAARAGGINTQAGFAGVVGNALVESGNALSPSAQNSRGCIGVFQWCPDFGRKASLENYARSKGKSSTDFGIQMEWFVQELKGADYQGRATVSALNATGDPVKAATEFNALFERAPGQAESKRQQGAQEIFNNLKCN